ncbi:MAG: hypothetical protein JW934_05490 [Anaerolineae bacterium]|nr:hypothetical protein [Anaerolineae bacterium]
MQEPKLFQRVTLVVMLTVLIASAFPSPALAATCTWTGAVDTDWARAANWSGCSGNVPGGTDTAIVPWVMSNDPILSTNTTVGSLTVQSSGELTIASGGALTINGAFTLAGTLTGDGDVTVNGGMDWTGGTLSGSGKTIIAPGATLTIDGSSYKSLSGRTIQNQGVATWSGTADIYGSGGAVFDNDGAFEVRNSESFGGSEMTFNNNGVFTKTLSSGTTEMAAVFNNNGVVNVQIGLLSLDAGGVSTGGHFRGAAGSTLRFNGATHDLDTGSSIVHPNVLFEWGTVNLNGDYDVGHTTLKSSATVNLNSSASVTSTAFTQSGGTLGGSADLVVTSAYNWTGGTLSGSGKTIIVPGATLTIDGSGYKSLSGRTIQNQGTATWSGSSDVYGSGGAVFDNDGTFEVRNSQRFGGSEMTFNNDGVFTKTLSSGTTEMDAVFNNNGMVNVQIGILSLDAGGVSTGGRFQGTAGSTLRFNGATHDLDAGSSITHPNVLFEWGTVNLNGAYDAGHTTLKSSATVNLNSSAPVTSTAFTQSGGTLGGSGDLVVTSTYNWTGGTLSGSGKTIIVPGATLTIDGSSYKSLSGRTIQNQGVATWSGSSDVYGSGGAVFDNDGTFEARNSQRFGGSEMTFNNNGVFTKTLSSGTTEMAAVFNNNGVLDVQLGVLTFFSADYIQQDGVTRLNGGDINVLYHKMDIQGGTLTGEGIVTGDMLNNGMVIPDRGPGGITVDGDYTQASAGTLVVEISGATASVDFSRLIVSGDVTLAGTLNVTLDSFTPADGDAFQIVTCDTHTGAFQTLHLPALPIDLFWRVFYTDKAIVLSVTKYRVFLPIVLNNQ